MMEGTISTPQEVINQYQKKANEVLPQYGKKVVTKSSYDLLKYAVIILGIGVLAFGYMALTGGFKTDIPSCPPAPACNCPEINIPNCPTNNCNPTLNCGNVTCSLPSNLNVNLQNSS